MEELALKRIKDGLTLELRVSTALPDIRIPSTYIRQLTTTWNSSSQGLMPP